MKKTLRIVPFLFTLLLIGFDARNQNFRVQETDENVVKLPQETIPLGGRINFSQAEDFFEARLKNTRVIHEPGLNPIKDQFLIAKAEANRLKNLAMNQGISSDKRNLTDPPSVGSNFGGNSFDGSTPNDNDLSVSAGNKIVSVTNSRIHMYSTSGSQIQAKSLASFVTGVSGVGSNSKYDPKTLYDPGADRFIVVFLNGSSSSSSKVIVCFSTTNDPQGFWNVYPISGNVTGSVWSDFVQIGISNDELFVTTNLFTNTGSSQGSAVWQISLSDGYAGFSLTNQRFSTTYFSLHPVSGGITNYGPNFYFVRSETGGGSTIYVHEISNTIGNGGTLASPIGITLDNNYTVPPDADQKGSTVDLSTGDARVQSAYFENDRIQFVFNSGFQNRASVYYGTIIISPIALSFSQGFGQHISFSTIGLGFPAIAYGGSQHPMNMTNSSFVSFNFASANDFPSCGSVFVDVDDQVSNHVLLKSGSSAVTGVGGRWGDYSGIQEKGAGEAWVGASYATSLGVTQTYISQLFAPAPVATNELQEEKLGIEIFPSPASERVNFSFEVIKEGHYFMKIFDSNGIEVASPINDFLRKGEASLNFSASKLSSGTYFVIVNSKEGTIFSEKFLVLK